MKYVKWLAAIVIGAGAGFSYWYFVGCYSGSCAITSSPVNSSIYGGLLGIMIFNSILRINKITPIDKGNDRRV